MPRQTSIEIRDNGDGTATVTVGGFEHQVSKESLFDFDDFNLQQVRDNMRLAFLIGGYAQPDSVEYINGVNKGVNGMETQCGRCTIRRVDLIDEAAQIYRVTYGFTSGPRRGQEFSTEVNLPTLQDDSDDTQVVIRNIPAFLRVAGHTFLSPAALAGLRGAKFWR